MTDQTTTTERMLNEDIDGLSLAIGKACGQIDRLQAENAELLEALKRVRGAVAALAKASHLMDGFTLAADGLPRARLLAATESDDLLHVVDAAIAKCEATS